MENNLKFERYTFAAILLILAAIIILTMLELPSETSEQVSGVIVKSPETTSTDATTAKSVVNADSKIINLNTATIEELDTLYGIGESRARSIIAYREHIGGYTSIEQIKDISGISDSVFEKIKDRITV